MFSTAHHVALFIGILPRDDDISAGRSEPATNVRRMDEPHAETLQHAEFAHEVNQYQAQFARSGDGEAHRGFHVKTHVAARAEFVVGADVPQAARYGVFAREGTFPAFVRISNGFSAARADGFPDLLGLSLIHI